jgi:hypothetical protein
MLLSFLTPYVDGMCLDGGFCPCKMPLAGFVDATPAPHSEDDDVYSFEVRFPVERVPAIVSALQTLE